MESNGTKVDEKLYRPVKSLFMLLLLQPEAPHLIRKIFGQILSVYRYWILQQVICTKSVCHYRLD